MGGDRFSLFLFFVCYFLYLYVRFLFFLYTKCKVMGVSDQSSALSSVRTVGLCYAYHYDNIQYIYIYIYKCIHILGILFHHLILLIIRISEHYHYYDYCEVSAFLRSRGLAVRRNTPNLPAKIVHTKICWLKPSGIFPMRTKIPTLRIHIMLESNPLKSITSVRRLAVRVTFLRYMATNQFPWVHVHLYYMYCTSQFIHEREREREMYRYTYT